MRFDRVRVEIGLRPRGRSPSLVEAGGQQFRGFRSGLDYAFIRAPERYGCGACYSTV